MSQYTSLPTKPISQSLILFGYAQDIEAQVAFYRDYLQFSVARDQGDCIILRAANAAYLGFCRRPGKTIDPNSVIITLVRDDVDEVYSHFMQNGIEAAPPVLNEKYAIYHFFVRDPAGYLVEVQKFLQPLD